MESLAQIVIKKSKEKLGYLPITRRKEIIRELSMLSRATMDIIKDLIE